MTIYYTRHARQRIKLYQIDKDDIENILLKKEGGKEPIGEKKEFVAHDFVTKYGFPLKIAFVNEGHRVTVITVFPFDRKTKYEDIVR